MLCLSGAPQSMGNEIKRSSAVTPKKDDSSASASLSGNGNSSLSNSRRSVSNSRSGTVNNSAEANRDRRIGSGRIPLRDSWNDVTSPSMAKGANNKSDGDSTENIETASKSESTYGKTFTIHATNSIILFIN